MILSIYKRIRVVIWAVKYRLKQPYFEHQATVLHTARFHWRNGVDIYDARHEKIHSFGNFDHGNTRVVMRNWFAENRPDLFPPAPSAPPQNPDPK